MPWVKLDDRFPTHRKVALLSDRAFRLYVSALCWCSENLTEGHITERELPVVTRIRGARTAAKELEEAGLWDRTADGWAVHDYLEYNPDRVQVKAERQANAARQQAFRDRKKAEREAKRAAEEAERNGQRNGVTHESESAFGDSNTTRRRHDGDTNSHRRFAEEDASPQVNAIRNAVSNDTPSPAPTPTPFSPNGEKGTASRQRAMPDQLGELKQAIAAAGIRGVGWALRESQWEHARQAQERVGIAEMVAYAVNSARLRGVPATAGAWIDGWRSLEAPPEQPNVAYLPAVVNGLPPKPSTTDQRVQAALDLAARFAREDNA